MPTAVGSSSQRGYETSDLCIAEGGSLEAYGSILKIWMATEIPEAVSRSIAPLRRRNNTASKASVSRYASRIMRMGDASTANVGDPAKSHGNGTMVQKRKDRGECERCSRIAFDGHRQRLYDPSEAELDRQSRHMLGKDIPGGLGWYISGLLWRLKSWNIRNTAMIFDTVTVIDETWRAISPALE